MNVEPLVIAEMVESFVDSEHEDDRKYENRTPLDESGVWTLHQLAGRIYAAGFDEGSRTTEVRGRGRRQRKSDSVVARVAQP
jgi:hypothetical protein